MGFDEGQVVFDSPNLMYFSGQTVRGRLEFEENYFMTFRGLYVLMTGFCDVNWTTTHTRKVEDRDEEYTVEHNSHEVYYEQKVYFAGGVEGEHQLGVGHHVFPFECRIPPHCPSSFEGSNGHIRYIFKFVVDRAFQLDLEKTRTINVITQKDLNTEPYCRQPMSFHFQESYCCWCMNAGGCEIQVKLPASGFCPKQTIPIELSVANDSNVEITLISFEIKQTITYEATHEPDKRYDETTIATLKKGPVAGSTTRNWALEMDVPDLAVYNLDACKFINIQHVFKVTVSPSGCHADTEGLHRIVLGHIPLRDSDGNPPPEDQISNQPIAPVQQLPGPQIYPAVVPAFPGANPVSQPYPGSNPPYPGANPTYPVYPETDIAIPGVNPSYPGANPPFPGANPPFPGANPQFPGANSPFPVANPPFPGSNPPFPGSNPPFPGSNPPFSGENRPSPEDNPQPNNQSFGFVAPVNNENQNVAIPSLPSSAVVPYPNNPASVNPYMSANAPPSHSNIPAV